MNTISPIPVAESLKADETRSPEALIAALAVAGRAAQAACARMSSEARAHALVCAAAHLRQGADAILAANAKDVAAANANGLSLAMIDRLTLDEARLEGVAAAVEAVANLPDPVGEVIDEVVRPNGLKMSRVRVPIGTIGIIYESRPNVTADSERRHRYDRAARGQKPCCPRPGGCARSGSRAS